MEEMNAVAAYGALLSEIKPEVIRTQRQNQAYVALLERLASKPQVDAAERKLIELLTVLIENYEAKEFPVTEASPVEVLRHLMQEHNLRQKDLVDVFGAESIVSEVLRGKRELAKEHIRRLSARFHVSPAVFF
jgi:HTH-type transcriptional regulator/antitoxin HigA